MGDNGVSKTQQQQQEQLSINNKSNASHNNNNNNNNLSKLIIPDTKQQFNVVSSDKSTDKTIKKKRRDKSDLGDNFVAPDGGWGWLVSIASGVNVLVTFALAQQFGIIFRDHMKNLGISSSQLTTIINVQIAVSAISGLLNGPLFRRYTYRQVALVGSVLTFIGLFLCVFADSFPFYVLSFSCTYGLGRGLTVSASSLAVNTFFKEKRRTATAFQYGVAGIGPIVLPYCATFLIKFYGIMGTVLLFSGLSLNTIACSLIYQPVKWHVKKQSEDAEASTKLNSTNDHEDIITQTVEPDTPVLPRANDGWFGSRTSLNSTATYRNRLGTFEKQQMENGQELKRLNSQETYTSKARSFSVSHSIKEEGPESENEHDEIHRVDHKANEEKTEYELVEEERSKMTILQKIVVFFDLDLLRDFTYVNLAVGLTLINFVEINFAILTPFILSDFGFTNSEIAMAMSLLGLCDLVVRFLVPLITAKIQLSNKTFFIIGILGMCIGRIFLSFMRNFYVLLAICLFLGLSKGFRTVFWSIIIPGYVPLKRLPAAAGLQLLMSGIFSLVFGPLIGLIRDNTNYAFTLNFLNALCLLAIAMWLLESFIRKYRKKPTNVNGGLNK